jgi:hypothetical protein
MAPPGARCGVACALAAAAGAVLAGDARASPELPLDDPAYFELARLRAAGVLPPYLGGLRLLDEARVQALRRAAGLPPDPHLLAGARGAWIAPVRRLRMRGLVARDRLRPYSRAIHPRDLAGGVMVTCEHREGRACGDGAGLEWEVDAAAGVGDWLAAVVGARAVVGTSDHDLDAAVESAYLRGELGPVALVVGRAPLALGPSSRTQAVWGDHPPPLDQLRLSTARPLGLIGPGGSVLRASALFFLGRLRDPQRFDGTLVDGTRLQFDLWNTAELGATHLIQLGGDGAPDFSFGDYLLEHTQHNADVEFANHRLGLDASVSLPSLAGARVYYELAAEDLRDEMLSMVRRDADHVLGVEVDRVAESVALLVELTSTGVRSHEHQLFTTGLTSGGLVAGAPLGPSTRAAFAEVRLDFGRGVIVWPWAEIADQSSDVFDFPTGDIERTEDLPDELRIRSGARAAVSWSADLRFEARVVGERVSTADFVPERIRWNGAVEASATWTPGWRSSL